MIFSMHSFDITSRDIAILNRACSLDRLEDDCALFSAFNEYRCDFMEGEGVADLFGPIDMLI